MTLFRAVGWITVTLVLAAGCSRPVKSLDGDEMDHPLMKRAKQKEQSGDIQGAVQIYQALLERSPSMARVHLSLALLLDRPHGNYVRAIYHYEQYLAMRPETEKRAMIESRARSATLALVGTVFSNQTVVVKRLDVLEKENDALVTRNANLEAQLQQNRAIVKALRARMDASALDASKQLERSGMLEAGIQPALPTVRVERHDTLRKIAQRIYGNQDRWKDIYDANRNVLRRPEDVKVGQVLVVPK
jgi:tetratricopeptide (TPR) repeat protein